MLTWSGGVNMKRSSSCGCRRPLRALSSWIWVSIRSLASSTSKWWPSSSTWLTAAMVLSSLVRLWWSFSTCRYRDLAFTWRIFSTWKRQRVWLSRKTKKVFNVQYVEIISWSFRKKTHTKKTPQHLSTTHFCYGEKTYLVTVQSVSIKH